MVPTASEAGVRSSYWVSPGLFWTCLHSSWIVCSSFWVSVDVSEGRGNESQLETDSLFFKRKEIRNRSVCSRVLRELFEVTVWTSSVLSSPSPHFLFDFCLFSLKHLLCLCWALHLGSIWAEALLRLQSLYSPGESLKFCKLEELKSGKKCIWSHTKPRQFYSLAGFFCLFVLSWRVLNIRRE